MRFGQIILFSTVAVTLAIPALATTRTRRGPTSARKTSAKHAAKPHAIGQRTIDDERATQIQSALIKAGYLTGSPSGHWDAQSEAAMQKLQGDNGWQTKLVPDSRALIKLGLGPVSASADTASASASAGHSDVSPGGSIASQATPLAPAAQ
jgi:peptidoglycan hydrolase-like protein with peptidoglycan-binding domain